jgi:DNA helicase II / ATP-dependent DNA helicase PcrA
VLGAISRAKNELIGADDYPIQTYRDEDREACLCRIPEAAGRQQRRGLRRHAVYTARLLEDVPSVRDKYAQRFRHVLVDEFQDTNLLSMRW